MFIYHGKLNSSRGMLLTIATYLCDGKPSYNSAPEKMITIIFPKSFELNDPTIAFWSCSSNPELGEKKANVANSGFISTVAKTANTNKDAPTSTRIHFSFASYHFDGVVSADFKTLSLTMNSWIGQYRPFRLDASSINVRNVHRMVVYTSNLNWDKYAKDELVTIVIPHGIAKGMPFGLFFMWTIDPHTKDTAKQSNAIEGEFEEVNPTVQLDGGEVTATYTDTEGDKYTFKFRSHTEGTLTISNNKVCPPESANNFFEVAYKL